MREVINQFLSNAQLYSSVLSDRLKCSSVLEEVTKVGSPFQMVGAAWLKARSVKFSLFLRLVSDLKIRLCLLSLARAVIS